MISCLLYTSILLTICGCNSLPPLMDATAAVIICKGVTVLDCPKEQDAKLMGDIEAS